MKDGGVIFDLDGTLIASESTYLRAWHEAARETGERMTDELYVQLMGFNRADTIRLLGESWGSVDRATRFVDLSQRHYDRHVKSGHTLRPGIRELLDYLVTREVPLAVATSSSRSLADATLAATGLAPYFRTCVGGDEVIRGKPDPEIYLAAAARLGLQPTRCLAFEDTAAGTAAALAAGMTVVLVPELPEAPGAGRERVHRFDDHGRAFAWLVQAWPGTIDACATR